VISIGSAIVSFAVLILAGMPASPSHPYVIASGIIHVGYFLLLGLSYRYAEYTAVYPLMRGTAPLLTTLAGVLLLGEWLSTTMSAGIALLSLGVLSLGAHSILRGGLNMRGLMVAAANIAVIVAYTVIDGVGVRLSGNPAGYVTSMILLTGILMVALVGLTKPRQVWSSLTDNWLMSLIGGALLVASYGAALWAMTRAPIGAVAALRETSVLFGTVIGALFLNERLTVARGLATVAIFAGLACMRAS
jgi:drug/metabolite transporter (DMT)-like permease